MKFEMSQASSFLLMKKRAITSTWMKIKRSRSSFLGKDKSEVLGGAFFSLFLINAIKIDFLHFFKRIMYNDGNYGQ